MFSPMFEASERLNAWRRGSLMWNMARPPVLGWKQSVMTTAYVTCSISLGLDIPGQFKSI